MLTEIAWELEPALACPALADQPFLDVLGSDDMLSPGIQLRSQYVSKLLMTMKQQRTSLHDASLVGDADEVERLLREGSYVNARVS